VGVLAFEILKSVCRGVAKLGIHIYIVRERKGSLRKLYTCIVTYRYYCHMTRVVIQEDRVALKRTRKDNNNEWTGNEKEGS
jgi:hypothetical protein